MLEGPTPAVFYSRVRILVSLDASDTARKAARWAVRYAQNLGARDLFFAHVVEAGNETSTEQSLGDLERATERLRQLAAEEISNELGNERISSVMQVRYLVRKGRPDQEILDAARQLDCDAIVMGNNSRRGVDRFFVGNVAERVIRGASCTVIIVKPKDEPLRP